MRLIVVEIRLSHDMMINSTLDVLIVVVVPPTPNVNGTVHQPLHSTVNLLTPVSLLKTNVVKQTPVKHPLHQNSKQKQTILSFSVMPSMLRVHISDTRSPKQEVQHPTPTSHHSSPSERVSNIQLLSTLVPTRSRVSMVQQPTPMLLSQTTV